MPGVGVALYLPLVLFIITILRANPNISSKVVKKDATAMYLHIRANY